MRRHPLVEHALATLGRLADAQPEIARTLLAELEHAWTRPLAVGIGGDLPARTALVNAICGDKLLDPYARAPGCAAIRLRVGDAAGFRAHTDDGVIEQEAPPRRADELVNVREREAAAREAVHRGETAIARIDAALPKRPRVWALWSWPIYWLAMWRHRPASRAADTRTLDAARSELAARIAETAALEAALREAMAVYAAALHAVASDGATGVREVELVVSEGVPPGVEIVELAGASRAGAEVDAVLLVRGDRVLAPSREPIELGARGELASMLPALLSDARALRLARRVRDKLASALAVLTDTIDRREAALQARVDRLHALRVGDPSAFAGTQLARVTGDISASVTAVIEHASVHLRAEVAALQQDWIGSVARAGDGKALDAALERIAGEWHARPQRIADEFRVLVMGGLAGSARDIFPVLGRPLVDHGLPEEHLRVRVAPVIAPIPLLPSLLDEPPKLEKAGWLAGLFKSFDARRSSIREKAHERIERLRERADAELLDAEPLLHDAIRSALAHMFDDAAAKQQAWLDAALAAERTSVAVDRLALAPLVRVRDTARRDGEELAERITRLERDQPAVSVAAAAAATASLSR